MWVSDDGLVNTRAIPTDHLWALPAVREFTPDLAAFTDWDYGRDGGPVDDLIAEAERGFVGASDAEEAVFREERVPDDVIVLFPWGQVVDPDSAEAALRKVPLRWRLDLAQVVEDLVEDLADRSTAI